MTSNEVDSILECVTNDFIQKHSFTDPVKAAVDRDKQLERAGAEINEKVDSRKLFLYANQVAETLQAQLQDPPEESDSLRLQLQTKIDILEKALQIQTIDYLQNRIPVNTNIAQHALFSANPKNEIKRGVKTVHGVKSVHIKHSDGQALTTYDARIMGAIQSIWFRQGFGDHVEIKYADILKELGLTDGAKNYKRIQESLIRLMKVEVTLTQYQKDQFAEYEEIALTRLIDQIVFRRKIGSTQHFQHRFTIHFPDWLVEANREGEAFDISLILMNDLKSYLAQGLYWLFASYSDEEVTLELSTLAEHFHFYDDDHQLIMPVYKIIDRLKKACTELKEVGFIRQYSISGKKQGLNGRYLHILKHPVFLQASVQKPSPKQIDLFTDNI